MDQSGYDEGMMADEAIGGPTMPGDEGKDSPDRIDNVATPGMGDPSQPLGERLFSAFSRAYVASQPVLFEASEHRAFYAGYQWTDEQRAVLIEQGRAPIVVNQIAKAIDNVCGRERGMRLKPKLLPRNAQDAFLAEVLTHGVEYVREASDMSQVMSTAFKDAAIGPMGWVGVEYDDNDPTVEPIQLENVHPLMMLRDPASVKRDLGDCRYLVRRRRVPYDVAKAAYPEQAEAIQQAITEDIIAWQNKYGRQMGDYDNRPGTTGWGWIGSGGVISFCDHNMREVELRETWWWHYEDARFVALPDGTVYELDMDDEQALLRAQDAVLQYGPGVIRDGQVKCFRWAVTAGPTLLATGKSKDKHRRFPYVPVWCKLDDLNRPYGLVRAMLDPQKELNTARARLNESMRSRWALVREGMMPPARFKEFVNGLARAVFAFEVKDLSGVQIGSDKADSQMWANQQETCRREVDDVAGLNEANYGDKSNETSGEAIKARAAQAAQNQGEIYDNLRWATQRVTELVMTLMIQYYPTEKLARIVQASAFRAGEQVDMDQLRAQLADAPLDALRFDVIASDQVETGTEQQIKMRQAVELMQMLPDAAKMALLPDVLRMSDFPDAASMAGRIEQAMQPAQPPQGMLPQGSPDMAMPMVGAAPVPAMAVEA